MDGDKKSNATIVIVIDKRNVAIAVLLIALVASGIGNVVLFSIYNQYPEPPEITTLKFGIYNRPSQGPWDLDPIKPSDSRSRAVIEQVCEGLYMHNLSDPNLGIIPRLASDYGTWDSSGKYFTVPLRRNVWFHDGTPFNAEAVKWNFERINWFTNASGTLNTTRSQIHSLWEFTNGTLILDPINPITINNEYSVTINLRAPYTILEPLLCHLTAFMLSPKTTPKYEYISTSTGKIVGTGPFVYDYYITDTEIKFHRWARYWRTGAYFEVLIFYLIDDSTAMSNAIRSHSVDCIIGCLASVFCGSDYYSGITCHFDTRGLPYYYLGMNNIKINKTWRQAISYAINYTYIISELQDGTVYRSNGPLAPTFPMYDPNIKSATWDLAKARTLVQSMGFAGGLTADNLTTGANDDAWKALSIATWNYSYNVGNSFREDLGVLLLENLNHIGIDVVDQGMSYDDFLNRVYGDMEPGGYDSLELYWVRWSSDFLSPYKMIFPLFSNKSASNSCQYHNHTVEMWLEEVLLEINATKRAELYSKILHQIIEVDMPHAFGYHPHTCYCHLTDLKGVPYNSMGRYYFYPMYRDSDS